MTLGLEISLSPSFGAAAIPPLSHMLERELVEDDIALLLSVPAGALGSSLKRLTDRHHAFARMLATGLHTIETAALTIGYAPGSAYAIYNSPAFKELLHFYRMHQDLEARSNFERLTGLAADAADILQDRLEAEPEKFSNNQLLEITKVAADRTGLGPSSSSVQVNVNLNLAERMKLARERAARASEPKLVEINPQEQP